MSALLALLPLLAAAAAPPAQDAGDDRDAPPLAPDGEVPAVLLRTPGELPRAAEGRWEGFFDPDGAEERIAALPEELLAAQAAAEAAYREGAFVPALEELYGVLEAQPDFPPALLVLGTAYFRLRRYGDCATALERFVEVAPEQVWRTQALGHAWYTLGEYERARDHYRDVLDAMPEELGESVEAVRGLALASYRLGDEERALELLDRVLELDPGHAEAHVWRGRILFDRGDVEEALAAADAARELDPYEPQPWYLRMQALYDLGRDEEAADAEERWRLLDRVAQEVRSIDMRLRYDPDQYPLAVRLVELHKAVGDVAAVRQALARALLARPPSVPEVAVRIWALDVLVDLGDEEAARVAALALEQTCPEEPSAWKRLERYYALRRDRVNQIRCGERYLRLGGADGG